MNRNSYHALHRLLKSAAVGLLAGLLLPQTLKPEVRFLLGWVGFCLVFLGSLWWRLWPATPQQTKQLATREDDSRAIASSLNLGAAVVSLVGVVVILQEANTAQGWRALWLTALGVGTVALSWMLVHSEYVLHYARRFYLDGGGIAFLDGDDTLDDPDFRDFLYLALTIGMTFQVSDTNINTRKMRHLLTAHAALSYLFGTVIVAVTINGIAGLIGG